MAKGFGDGVAGQLGRTFECEDGANEAESCTPNTTCMVPYVCDDLRESALLAKLDDVLGELPRLFGVHCGGGARSATITAERPAAEIALQTAQTKTAKARRWGGADEEEGGEHEKRRSGKPESSTHPNDQHRASSTSSEGRIAPRWECCAG